MFAYLGGFTRALFGEGELVRWLQAIVALVLGVGVFADYERIRSQVDDWVGEPVMPNYITWQMLAGGFMLWIIIRLGHNEAMQQWQSARIEFDLPQRHFPFNLYDRATGKVMAIMSSVTVTVRNNPYRTDSGNDVVSAWGRVELFNHDYKRVQWWDYPRWEDNKHPPYEGAPKDHFPSEQNFRTLRANRSSHIITIATKPFSDEFAYRMRGVDQITGWVNKDHEIPKGEYFVRLTIEGKGLRDKQELVFVMVNRGANHPLEIKETTKRIGRYWPR